MHTETEARSQTTGGGWISGMQVIGGREWNKTGAAQSSLQFTGVFLAPTRKSTRRACELSQLEARIGGLHGKRLAVTESRFNVSLPEVYRGYCHYQFNNAWRPSASEHDHSRPSVRAMGQ